MNINRTTSNEPEVRKCEKGKRIFLGGLLTAVTLAGGLTFTSEVLATDDIDQIVLEPDDRVCDQPPAHQPPVPNPTKSMVLTAPAGKLIVATCVKAGSAVQGEGPDYKTYPGVPSVPISHPSGKDISHYTVTYVDIATASAVYTEATCETAGVVVLSAEVGFTWSNSGSDDARTYTATAATGYQMTGPSVFGPYRIAKKTESCTPIVESEPPVPAAPTPAAAAPVAVAPVAVAPAAAPPAAVVSAVPTQLPSTGSSSWVTALMALAALAGGTGLVRLSRRPTD